MISIVHADELTFAEVALYKVGCGRPVVIWHWPHARWVVVMAILPMRVPQNLLVVVLGRSWERKGRVGTTISSVTIAPSDLTRNARLYKLEEQRRFVTRNNFQAPASTVYSPLAVRKSKSAPLWAWFTLRSYIPL